LGIQTSTTPKATAVFDPYAAIDSVISQQNQSFFDDQSINSQYQQYQRQTIGKSINSVGVSQVKDLFKSTISVGGNTRIINYGGTCKQITRTHNDNGSVEYQWSNTSLDCGVNDANKKQLQHSLNKFISPTSTH
jgi:hypothetical protein